MSAGTAPLPQGLLGRRRVWRAWRAGAELRDRKCGDLRDPARSRPAAARAGSAGTRRAQDSAPLWILPAGRSPSQPSGSLSSGPCFSPQACGERRRAFPAASRSSASPRPLLGAGSLVSEATLQASFPARDDPLVLYGRPSQGDALPEATAWRPSPPPAPYLPQTLAAAGSDRITERTRRLSSPAPLGTLFSFCHQPSPGHPGLTAAPRLWGDRTLRGGRWADSCCGPALSRGHPPLRPS